LENGWRLFVSTAERPKDHETGSETPDPENHGTDQRHTRRWPRSSFRSLGSSGPKGHLDGRTRPETQNGPNYVYYIGTLEAGDIFLGGAGNDYVQNNYGTFNGGDGNDTVSFNYGTTDSVENLPGV
jgi:hypothetical protein